MNIPTNIYVFNQYYLDLLKSLKNCAKKYKDKHTLASSVIKFIKKNYSNFDKNTLENITFFDTQFNSDFYDNLFSIDIDDDKFNEFYKPFSSINLYKDISILTVSKMLKNNTKLSHYLLILYLFKDLTLTDEETSNIVSKLKSIENISIDQEKIIIPERHILLVNKIIDLNIKKTSGFSMNEIEDTSIGKLAKDIMKDINIDKIKESVTKSGDIFQSLGDKEHGLGNILSDVSQKMASKLASGEIKQEDLLKDAMNFAGKIPQFGGNNNGNNNGMPDMANMMKMMSSMMGGGGGKPDMNKMKSQLKKMKKKM
jgi:hypothetical protein